jgi:hypothetical protein
LAQGPTGRNLQGGLETKSKYFPHDSNLARYGVNRCGPFSLSSRRQIGVTNHAGVVRQNGNLKASAASCQYRAVGKMKPWPVASVAGHLLASAFCKLSRMANLLLSPTRKHFRIGDKNDYCVLDGGRVVGRIFLNPQAPEGRPWFWTITAPDIPPSIDKRGYSATRWRNSRRGGLLTERSRERATRG